mmetsp:Transcript_18577/g.40450  ORF Transcript_18577/g.40450 Transcript_18577/m.40450 type:complete len:93 (+) Transcript_18577:63-341(+)
MSKFCHYTNSGYISKLANTVAIIYFVILHLIKLPFNIRASYFPYCVNDVFQDVETSSHEPTERDSRDNINDEFVSTATTSAATTTTSAAASE